MPVPNNPPPHIYTTVGLERAADRRRDPDWLAQKRRDPKSLVVALHDLRVLIADRPSGPDPFALTVASLGGEIPQESVFLGLLEERAVFALDMSGESSGLALRAVELRALAPLLPARELGLLAYARALLHWGAMQRFCGRCGGTLVVGEAGHMRWCPSCRAEFFPRTDPAVIVLVTACEHCVLGRSPRFPPGVYSTLAGFVEPGESLEAAVAREIREEVGLEIEGLDYRSSQPWPFPQSLMLGFRARARLEPLRIDARELEDARWFHRRELLDEHHRPVRLPAPDSIARYLIEEWLFEDS